MKRNHILILVLWSLLPFDTTITYIPRIVLSIHCLYNAVHLGSLITFRTARTSLLITGWLAAKGIEKGSELIPDGLFKLGSNFMPSMPMMMTMASAHESHAPVIRIFKQFGSSKEGDSDGDADNNSDKVERNQGNHEPKSAWERVLDKFAELSARLDQLEKMEGSCCPVDSGSQ